MKSGCFAYYGGTLSSGYDWLQNDLKNGPTNMVQIDISLVN